MGSTGSHWHRYCTNLEILLFKSTLTDESPEQKESLERKHIFPLHDFLTRTESIHHKSWNLTPWQVISWGLRQLGIGGGARGEDTLVVGCFVLLSNVEVRFPPLYLAPAFSKPLIGSRTEDLNKDVELR